jgi:hypothetical protein
MHPGLYTNTLFAVPCVQEELLYRVTRIQDEVTAEVNAGCAPTDAAHTVDSYDVRKPLSKLTVHAEPTPQLALPACCAKMFAAELVEHAEDERYDDVIHHV